MYKVKILGWTGLCSFLFSTFKWIISGTDYGCGLGAWPTFGFKAFKYTWFFDFQQNYIGSGMGAFSILQCCYLTIPASSCPVD